MSDVRLTAVNPEDSQVYPVACNDKGELVLESATDLDVAVKLDVADTVYADDTGLFVGYGPDDFRNRTIRLNKDGGSQYDGVVQTGGLVAYKRSGVADQNIALFNSDFDGLNKTKFKVTANGNTDVAGDLTIENVPSPTIRIIATGQGTALFGQGWTRAPGGNKGVVIAADNGPLVFRRGVAFDGDPGDTSTGTTAMFIHQDSGNVYIGGNIDSNVDNRNIELGSDGSATFNGNVTAPNINFKLAPSTAATMPAPLIDEGFAVDNKVDLLSELIKMKLQIRDLNAFMQRTLQEQNETTQ